MIKHVPIEAAFNYVPQIIKENTSPADLKSWMFQAYRGLTVLGELETEVTTINVSNHHAYLPDDVVLVREVLFSDTPLGYISDLVVREIDTDKLLVYQKILFNDDMNRYQLLPLKYKGQSKAAIIDSELFCRKCEVGFTLDKTMKCMTIDYVEGEVTLVYSRYTQDDGELLIPDHTKLLQGLAQYAIAMFWMNRQYSHEANASNFYESALMKAENLLNAYESSIRMRQVDVSSQRQFLFNRNKFSINERNFN
jgi:hypothetical protein